MECARRQSEDGREVVRHDHRLLGLQQVRDGCGATILPLSRWFSSSQSTIGASLAVQRLLHGVPGMLHLWRGAQDPAAGLRGQLLRIEE
jgi:hypothetical protein